MNYLLLAADAFQYTYYTAPVVCTRYYILMCVAVRIILVVPVVCVLQVCLFRHCKYVYVCIPSAPAPAPAAAAAAVRRLASATRGVFIQNSSTYRQPSFISKYIP